MKKLTLILLVLATFTACGPKNNVTPKQYSTWIVNGTDTFRTNNVDTSIDCNPDHSYCRATLQSSHSANYFILSFALDHFPNSGKYSYPSPSTPYSCAVHIYYNNEYYYHIAISDTLSATLLNNKAIYTIPQSWFFNNNNPTGDSILVQGTFSIP